MKKKIINDKDLLLSYTLRTELHAYAKANKWASFAANFANYKKYLLEIGIDYSAYPKDIKERNTRTAINRTTKIDDIFSE